MAKIDRYNGNVQAFGSTATGVERTVFGDEGTQSDTLDLNVTANFFRGWGILAPGVKPPKQFFNGLSFAISQFIAYLHQWGIAGWNVSQEYNDGSVTTVAGRLYYSTVDANIGNDPLTDRVNWRRDGDPVFRDISATGSIQSTDDLVRTTAPLANTNVTFLAANDPEARMVEVFRPYDDPETFNVTWFPTGGTLGGQASISLLPGEGYRCFPDGGTDYILRAS